jgi:hypothetical protein
MKQLKMAWLFTTTLMVSVFSYAQTADEVIDKHLAAIGGKEKLLTLSSVVMEGTLTVQGMEIPVKLTQVHNKGQRVDISAMGMNGYIIQTATEGWTYMPFQGQTKAEATPAEVVKETSDAQIDAQGILLNYKDKGHAVEFLGKEDVEGTECFKLKVTMKNGLVQTLFFDPSTYFNIKTITKSKASGQEVEQTQTYSNFKKIDEGFTFPFAMTGFGPGELVITKIEVNKPVDESLFKPSN